MKSNERYNSRATDLASNSTFGITPSCIDDTLGHIGNRDKVKELRRPMMRLYGDSCIEVYEEKKGIHIKMSTEEGDTVYAADISKKGDVTTRIDKVTNEALNAVRKFLRELEGSVVAPTNITDNVIPLYHLAEGRKYSEAVGKYMMNR